MQNSSVSHFSPMNYFRKIVYSVIATCSLMLGLILLYNAGIPNRADYTGYIIQDVGYVAPEINSIAPPFSLSTLDFGKLELEGLRGQIVILNFWATWCVPCQIEMPELQELYEQYNDEIRILGINLGESPQSVAQWVEEYNLTFDILIDPLQAVAQQYQIRGQPSTYVIDMNGLIHSIYYGPISMEQLEDDIHTIVVSSQG